MLVRTLTTAALAATIALPAPQSAHSQDIKRELTNVTGDVWRFQNKFHFSTVVVTSEGVVVTDPINTEAATWLEAEITARFGLPVTHMVYSHSHGDHASGGAVFADTATVIAQANAPAEIDGVAPNIRFAQAMSFTSGDHSFELTALGPGHGADMLLRPFRALGKLRLVEHVQQPLEVRPEPDDLDGEVVAVAVQLQLKQHRHAGAVAVIDMRGVYGQFLERVAVYGPHCLPPEARGALRIEPACEPQIEPAVRGRLRRDGALCGIVRWLRHARSVLVRRSWLRNLIV